MTNLIKFGISSLTYLVLSSHSFAQELKAHRDTESTQILCDSDCDIQAEIAKQLKKSSFGTNPDHRYDFIIQGEVTDSVTLVEYASLYQVALEPGIRKGTLQSRDGALECQYDPDYSCDDWMNIEFVNYAQRKLAESYFEFVITQDYINGNNEARRLAIAAATTLLVSNLASKLAAELAAVVYSGVTETAAAVILSELLQSSEWYETDLKPGDKLVFENGNITIVRLGSGGNQGGSGGGANENYGGYNYGSWYYHVDSYQCNIHYTGSHGNMVAQVVCY